MTIALAALIVAALALGLAAGALTLALTARKTAGEAHDAARKLASAAARRKRGGDAEPLDERDVDLGPPNGVPERRQRDDGYAGRHRPEPTADRYLRLRASADAREAVESDAVVDDRTRAIPAAGRYVEEEDPLATREHPAPDGRFRRPPPPLPRPGQIGRPQ